MHERRFAWLGFGGLAATLGACQLVSGLSSYHESGSATNGTAATGSGGAGSTSATGATATGSGGTTTGTGTGGCAAGTTICGQACVDLMTDPGHCGKCTRACPDPLAACVAGDCAQAAELGGPYASVTAISASETAVYWASVTGGVERIDYRLASSWTTPQTGLSPVSGVAGLAAAKGEASVFFTQRNASPRGLYRWTSTATSVELLSPGDAGLTDVGAVAMAEPTHVFWTGDLDSDAGVAPNVFRTTVLDGGILGAFSVQTLVSLVADDTAVYWLYATTPFNAVNSQTGADVPLDVTNGTTLDQLAVDADPAGALYWISGSMLLRIPKSPPGSVEMSGPSAVAGAVGLVVSQSMTAKEPDIYWLEGGSNCQLATGRLMKANWPASAGTPVAQSLTCPRNLAQDATYLYYSAGASKDVRVFRVAK
jgi:hypothetical protein